VHAGVLAIIGNGPNDAQSRAAMGTICKGIQISAIRTIEGFGQTIGTGGGIRSDTRSNFTVLAGNDPKVSPTCAVGVSTIDTFNLRERWGLCPETIHEMVDINAITGNPDADATRVIKYFAYELIFFGKAIHGRAEAHALYRAPNPYVYLADCR